jgi:hypothetical protein
MGGFLGGISPCPLFGETRGYAGGHDSPRWGGVSPKGGLPGVPLIFFCLIRLEKQNFKFKKTKIKKLKIKYVYKKRIKV